MGIVQPSGPSSHWGMCLGSVQAAKTRRRGASTARVMTTSRSLGVVNVVARVLVAGAIVLLLSLEVVEVGVEPRVTRLPEPLEFAGPLGDLADGRGVEGARTPLRFSSLLNETGALEHA